MEEARCSHSHHQRLTQNPSAPSMATAGLQDLLEDLHNPASPLHLHHHHHLHHDSHALSLGLGLGLGPLHSICGAPACPPLASLLPACQLVLRPSLSQ